MKRTIAGALMGSVVTGAVFGGLMFAEAGTRQSPSTSIWADACVVTISDASLYFPGWGYGSIKYVGGFVGNYNGQYLSDYAAQNAISAYDCERAY